MSLKHMILGCLMDSPSYGYEIKKFTREFFKRSQGVNEGQLYATLKKMEEDGLVHKELILQEKNPPRKVFQITEQGKEVFYSWLTETGEDGEIASFDFFQVFPFLERCNYFKHTEAEAARALVDRQMKREAAKLEEFKRVREEMQVRRVDRFRVSIIEFGIDFQRLKLNWLEKFKATLTPEKTSSDD